MQIMFAFYYFPYEFPMNSVYLGRIKLPPVTNISSTDDQLGLFQL